MSEQKTNYPALYTLITVFFFWGFIAAGNSIFIPFCKHYFNLDQFQSQLIDFAFYTAYYLGALFLFAYTSIRQRDLVGQWGYKKSIVYGLLFSALGAALMLVAVQLNVYVAMLVGLFVVALGFSLQQTAANPFAILLGDPATGASRVNLGGGINSFGTTIGPLLVGMALFGSAQSITDEQIAGLSLDKVNWLYSGVGLLFLGAAALFWFSKKVPAGTNSESLAPAQKALRLLLLMTVLLLLCFVPVFNSYQNNAAGSPAALEYRRMYWLLAAMLVVVCLLLYARSAAKRNANGWGAMRYPQLVFGMLAIFIYVGVEVAIGSNLGELLKLPAFGGLQSAEIAPYVSMYWGSLMIGRWAGAVAAFKLGPAKKRLALVALPLLAFLVILLANGLAGKDMRPLLGYVFCVFVQIGLIFLSRDKAARSLMLFAGLGVLAMAVGMFSAGMPAVYAILAGGLACSIMWPAIFSLALRGLGNYTAQGAAFLVMMILGGGILPPIQGKLSDIVGIQASYWLPLLGFVYLGWYALWVKRVLAAQGHFDEGDGALVGH